MGTTAQRHRRRGKAGLGHSGRGLGLWARCYPSSIAYRLSNPGPLAVSGPQFPHLGNGHNHSSLARLEDAGHGNQVRQPLRCGYRRFPLSRAPGQGSRGLTVCTCTCHCLQGVGSHAWHSLCCYHHLHRCYA